MIPALDSIQTFICIGAHCDDVEWGSGGLFARLVRQGARGIYVVAVENPYVAAEYPAVDAATALATRREESRQGAKVLGASRIEFFNFKSYYLTTPDREIIYPAYRSYEETKAMVETVYWYGLPPVENAYLFPECVDCLRSLIETEQPDLIVTHPPNDCHPDHYAVSRFVDLVVADCNAEGKAIPVLFHEPARILGLWRPTVLVELAEDDLAVKEEAYNCFPSQHPNGTGTLIRDMAKRSGRLGDIGLAEGYVWGGAAMDADWAKDDGFAAITAAAQQPASVIRTAE